MRRQSARCNGGHLMTAIPESITEAELAAAFGRLPLPGLYGGGEAELAAAFGRLPLPGLYGGGKMAASLVADVLAHREPEYEPGEAYADARSRWFLLRAAGYASARLRVRRCRRC